jgi:hypothetical protein
MYPLSARYFIPEATLCAIVSRILVANLFCPFWRAHRQRTVQSQVLIYIYIYIVIATRRRAMALVIFTVLRDYVSHHAVYRFLLSVRAHFTEIHDSRARVMITHNSEMQEYARSAKQSKGSCIEIQSQIISLITVSSGQQITQSQKRFVPRCSTDSSA